MRKGGESAASLGSFVFAHPEAGFRPRAGNGGGFAAASERAGPVTAEQERALNVRRNNPDQVGGEDGKRDYGDNADPQLERALDALKGMMIYKQQMASRK